MANVLVAYHSRTGNTEKMAKAVVQGATAVGARVVLKRIDSVTHDDLLGADAMVIGSPVYYGHAAAPVRQMFDDSVRLHGKLVGKVGGAFASSHNLAGGNETTVLEILESMLVHGMIIPGSVDGDHYGPVALGPPDQRADLQCRALGERVAKLAALLVAAPPATSTAKADD